MGFAVLLPISKLYPIQILGNEKVFSKLLKKYFQHKQRIYLLYIYISNRSRQGHDGMIAVFITTCCEFESRSGRGVQHYVITFVSDLRQVGGFLRVLRFRIPLLTSLIRQ